MNIFGKTLILLFLVATLASCSSQSTPTISDAEIMETAIATVSTTLAETQRAIPTNTPLPTVTTTPTLVPRPTDTPSPTYTPLPGLPPNAADLQWMTAYGLPGDQSVTKIHPTKDGGFILVGKWVSGPSLLLKLRADGLIVWQKSLPQVRALDVLETSAGHFILAGDLDWIKFDSQGNLLWQYPFEGPSYHTGPIIRLVEESNGNIVVEAVGSRTVFNADGELQSFTEDAMNSDFQMSPGEAIDRFHLDENQFNYVFFVQTTADGGAIVGNAVFEDYGDVASWQSHIIISRFSEDGSLRWQKGYGGYLGAGYEDFHAFETKSGDIIVAGTVFYFADNVYRNHVWMLRLDRDGNTHWMKAYGTAGWDPEGQDAIDLIQELPNGDLIFAGHTNGTQTGDQDMWVLKMNAQGEIPGCSLALDPRSGGLGGGASQGQTISLERVSVLERESTPTFKAEPSPFGDAAAQARPFCPPSP